MDRSGLTTEQFVDAVVVRLEKERQVPLVVSCIFFFVISLLQALRQIVQPQTTQVDPREYDEASMRKLFESIDSDKNGSISFEEFASGMKRFFVAPVSKK